MREVRFYHLTRQSLEQALPALLEKTVERGWRGVVRGPDESRIVDLNKYLWTYSDNGFLPHGMAADGNEAEQPLFLTTDDVNPNSATVLFLLDGLTETVHSYDLICLVFSGADEAATAAARTAWASYKEAGNALTYWQQGDKGWEKKA